MVSALLTLPEQRSSLFRRRYDFIEGAGSKGERAYASQSRINATAAGAAWTKRILRLTVAAP